MTGVILPPDIPSSTPDFWSWLAGLTDGEGCFTIFLSSGTYHAKFAIAMRADDWRALYYARERSGLGILTYKHSFGGRENTKPAMAWTISTIDECKALIVGFDSGCGLLSKKRRDYDIWREAVDLLDRHGGGRHSESHDALGKMKQALHSVKAYHPETAAGADLHTGRNGNGVNTVAKTGRAGSEFWASDTPEARRAKQWRQLRYAKLSQTDIDEIVRRDLAGEPRVHIARDFGITSGLISKFTAGQYLRRDGTLFPVVNEQRPKASSPDFWKTEAGERAHKRQALLRGKLSQDQIDEIVSRYKAGDGTMASLAAEFGVSRPLVSKFIKGNYIRRD